jgi:hypothetical protein
MEMVETCLRAGECGGRAEDGWEEAVEAVFEDYEGEQKPDRLTQQWEERKQDALYGYDHFSSGVEN